MPRNYRVAMRFTRSLLASMLLLGPALAGQTPTAAGDSTTADLQAPLRQALVGHWTGALEYRDYSEPAASTKRVELPTWLTISGQPEGLRFEYVYDDGPGKVVTEKDAVVVDVKAASYRVTGEDHTDQRYAVAGLESLKDGRGTLTLSGPGTDNKKPAEIRTTWVIRRNLLSWLEEVRPAGTGEAFVFRHRYTFTRAEAPIDGGASRVP